MTENATTNTWSVRNSLVFNKLFKDVHSVTLQVGFEVSSNTATGSRNTRYGYLRYRERLSLCPDDLYHGV